MNPCDGCPLPEKVYECCGRFPDTGETVVFVLDDDVSVAACPHLDANGRCRIYAQRPLNCRMHTCEAFGASRANDYSPAPR